MKPMWPSYGERARSGGLSEARDLPTAVARLERWSLPLAILVLFAYPNPLVPLALAFVVASGAVRLPRRATWSRATPVDPWIALLGIGTLGGLAVAHNQDAALQLAAALLGLGEIPAARSLLGPILARPHDDDMRTRARTLLGQISKLQEP